MVQESYDSSRLWHTKPEQKAQVKTLKWGNIEKAVLEGSSKKDRDGAYLQK